MSKTELTDSRVSEKLKADSRMESVYNYITLYQTGGGSSFTIGATSMPIQFIIPPGCYSLGNSRIDFTMTPTAQSSSYNNIFVNTFQCLNRITLGTNSNAILVDIPFVNNYLHSTMRYQTSLEELLTNPLLQTTAISSKLIGNTISTSNCFCSRNNSATGIVSWISSKSAYIPALETANFDDSYTETQFTGIQEILQDGSTGHAGPVIKVSFPLSAFRDCLLAKRRSIYWNEPLNLTLNFDVVGKCGFYNTSNVVFATGAATLSASIALSNLSLQLAREVNPDVERKCLADLAHGLELNTAFVTCNSFPTQASTSQQIVYTLPATQGKLLKVFTSPYYTAPLGLNAFNHDGANVTSWDVYLNNVRLDQVTQTPELQWRMLHDRKLLRGCANQSYESYLKNFSVINSFVSNKRPLWRMEELDLSEEGLPDGMNLQFQYVFTTSSVALQWYQWYVTVRKVLISAANGVAII